MFVYLQVYNPALKEEWKSLSCLYYNWSFCYIYIWYQDWKTKFIHETSPESL